MIFEKLRLNKVEDDHEFNKIYPEWIRNLAQRHWTSIDVVKKAVEFLVNEPGTKVLDIGSGPGKFCMVGATYTNGHFTGVEQRYGLVEISKKISREYNVSNVNFIHANISSLSFKDYDAFYFFNPFHENIDFTAKIDDTVRLGAERYDFYHNHVYEEFYLAPVGTRIVTYHSHLKEIPPNYELQFSFYDGLLKFWKKIR